MQHRLALGVHGALVLWLLTTWHQVRVDVVHEWFRETVRWHFGQARLLNIQHWVDILIVTRHWILRYLVPRILKVIWLVVASDVLVDGLAILHRTVSVVHTLIILANAL